MIAALAGGVGGAKLAQGLALAIQPSDLTVVVNTADDLDLFGLRICPDLDTVLYTLAGIANPATGWGIENDTHYVLEAIGRYGRELWFQLGDRDFATHILRTERLKQGASLSAIMRELSSSLGVKSKLLPMSDDVVATKVHTPVGLLDFQDYFVARRQEEDVLGLVFVNAEVARPSLEALDAIREAELVVFCPSNPLVSIGPILSVPGFRQALESTQAPVVAVSPIIAGKALKGPADKMLNTLGHEVSSLGVAKIYEGLVDAMVIHTLDEALAPPIEALGMGVLATNSIMGDADDRRRLALEVLTFGRSLVKSGAVA